MTKYQEWRAAGLCGGCGKVPPKEGRARCQDCLDRGAECSLRNYEANKPAALKRMRLYMDDAENRGQWNQRAKQRRLRVKEDVLSHYGGHCACCGETHVEFLTLDHVDGDGRDHRRSLSASKNTQLRMTGARFYQFLRRNNYPKKPRLQVLCCNCHVAKDKYGYCPHTNAKR